MLGTVWLTAVAVDGAVLYWGNGSARRGRHMGCRHGALERPHGWSLSHGHLEQHRHGGTTACFGTSAGTGYDLLLQINAATPVVVTAGGNNDGSP